MRIPSFTVAPAQALARAAVTLAFTTAVCLNGAVWTSTAVAAPPPVASRSAPVVAILLSPFLTYADLSPTATPALWSLAENGAVGSMNAMTADPGWPTVAGGALTLSAGRWASAAATGPADAATLAAQQAANQGSRALPTIGALGEAVRSAGGRTAAVGTSDPGTGTAVVPLHPAELVATDSRGEIDFVATGKDLLVADADAPLGVRSDNAALASAIASALAEITSAPGRGGLVVVDPGDLARAHAAASPPGTTAARSAVGRRIAITALDAAAAELSRQMPQGSLLLVVTQTTEKPYYEPPYFGPVIASGRGLKGLLTSASTHRPGLVSGLDVAPTALGVLGIPVPATMIGSSFSSVPDGAPVAQRFASLSRTADAAGAVDKLRDLYFTHAFVWFALLCVSIALVGAFYPARWLAGASNGLLLSVLSAPPAAWIALFIARYPATPRAAGLAFAIAWVATSTVAILLARLVRRPAAALAGMAAATVVLIVADQWFAGPLESGLFSYSIRAGWRYYGIGNEGSALAVAAALAAVGLACDLAADRPWAVPLRRYALPVVGAIVLVTAAGPFAGANAGVAVWGFIGFAVAWLRMNKVRLSVRTVAWTMVATLLLVGALAAVDILGGGGGTHIGRFFLETVHDSSGAWELVRRKALNNLDYVTQTPYSWLAAVMALALLVERFAGPKPLRAALSRFPAYAGAFTGIIVGAVFALLTEDSGVVMPALMLLAGALPAMYLALLRPQGTRPLG